MTEDELLTLIAQGEQLSLEFKGDRKCLPDRELILYVRQSGFDPIQHEAMVMRFIEAHGSIKRADVMELCKIGKDQAYRILKALEQQNKIKQEGERRWARYVLSR